MRTPNLCGFDGSASQPHALAEHTPRWQKFPGVALALTLVFLAFIFVPRVHDNPRLVWTFAGVAAGLAVWASILWIGAKRWQQRFRIEFVPLAKAHYIQGSVQLCLYAYWGWYWRPVYEQIPLILAQLVFFYAFDALLTWSRGRDWRLGCGPLPIILSTNVFIWFIDDWFAFQFLLIATAALGKEFIKWSRDGRTTHIFNPSAFSLALFSVVLLATGRTDVTWAGKIADSFSKVPNIYVVIFSLGLIVQYFFSVTLMTLSAVAALCVLGFAYHWGTGTYFFIFSNITAPVFLGLHLLVTDPATSPRSNVGRVIFGALYGTSAFVLYGALSHFDLPTVYDKLLPIPILNLLVPMIERFARSSIVATFNRWEAAFQPRKLNLVHMGGWTVLFMTLLGTGYVQGQHEGSTYQFWKQALDEGRPNAANGLLEVLKSQALDGSASAWNELGVIALDGRLVPKDPNTAVRYFAKATKMGSIAGSANLITQFLTVRGAPVGVAVTQAFDQLEQECVRGTEGAVYNLVGRAYETGNGRPLDRARARSLFKEGCERGDKNSCDGVTRIPLPAPVGQTNAR